MSDRIADIRARLEAATQGRGARYEAAAATYYDLAAHAPADIAYLLEQVAAWQQATAAALADVERWHRLYDNERVRAERLSARVAQLQVIE